MDKHILQILGIQNHAVALPLFAPHKRHRYPYDKLHKEPNIYVHVSHNYDIPMLDTALTYLALTLSSTHSIFANGCAPIRNGSW